MNKLIYVPSKALEFGKELMKEKPTGEKTKGLFGGEKIVTERVREWTKMGESESEIDGAQLAEDIAMAIEKLNDGGYEVVAITPLTTGICNYSIDKVDKFVTAGYGYSRTVGVTVVGKKMALVE